MKYYKSKVMCDTCDKEFSVLSNESGSKDWYVSKNLPNCKHHTKDNKRSTIHKHLRGK